MKKAIFLLFAVSPVILAGAGCAGQEAKANFSAFPLESSPQKLLQKAAEKTDREALVKDNQKLKEENTKLEQKVAKMAKAKSIPLKEFEETNSFIKKSGEAKEAEEKEPPKLPTPADTLFLKPISPAVVEFYNRQLVKERNTWLSNMRTAFSRHGGYWRASVIPVQGGMVVQYRFCRLAPPSHYAQGVVFVSDSEMMAKWRDKLSSLAEDSFPVDRKEKIPPIRKGKKKLL